MFSRRQMLQHSAFAAAAFTTPGLFAELIQTASMTEGPFYPDTLPLDTDNDLLILNDALTPAAGEVTHLTGRVLSATGEPIRNAFVEIWQCDNNGAYLHSGTGNADNRDSNFQGYGRFLTDSKGQYYFRTIKPVPYPGRTPHIHFGISRNGKRIFTTQMLVKGHPGNESDGLFRRINDPKLRETVLVDFQPLPDSKIGALSANFDLVLGHTLEELEDGTLGGGIGKSEWSQQGRGFGPGRGARQPR
ncbi:Protocatechuate 3,4-dioxygenase beta chain [Maioricimonas rarisocia]|uniref:Protocatechuate 3,4-dioxygenase beta chain n=1 Tax=Maioricimonas rarisocia TaxID=2528026 RepID=A0A517ZFG7_9PLAN|nr:protocatechuate 3,4-dioxygenase [Maioricimonas rarisocia]QDU41211.1 Protocatechuate 3,4-dioxygenase beta chain [Maioricimonas rarisocia]